MAALHVDDSDLVAFVMFLDEPYCEHTFVDEDRIIRCTKCGFTDLDPTAPAEDD